VLVLQNLALERWPRWHYAVVVGYLPDQDRFVLRSGSNKRHEVSRTRFLATWIRAGRWGLVVLPPDASPEGLDAASYLKAAAALESAGRNSAALAAFETAVVAWPEQPTAWLGRANNLYLLGRRAEAEAAYAAVLERTPGHPVALHNLAALLVEEGRACAARALLPPAAPGEPALVTQARAAADQAVAAESGARACP
jgi:Flp pilus assembly protein TadD